MSNNVKYDPAKRREDWETPGWLFDFIVQRCGFDFTIDLAADKDNKKCRIYLDAGDDFLRRGYLNKEWAWCNPPYKEGGREMKLWAEALMQVPKCVCLIPASPGARWWQQIWEKARYICFVRGRLKFELGGKALGPAPFDSAIVIKGWNPLDIKPPNYGALREIGNVIDLYSTLPYREVKKK